MNKFVLPILLGISLIISIPLSTSSHSTSLSTSSTVQIDTLENTFNKVYKGVVGIQGELGEYGSIGSGFIFSKDEEYHYVLTNNHVVDSLEAAFVRLHNGKLVTAEILGTEPNIDVALLRMPLQEEVVELEIGDSSYINVGEEVFAIGNPMSVEYSLHLSLGIVSSTRVLFTSYDQNNRLIRLEKRQYLTQVDTPINPGNSGGPLFNMLGQVIGINSSKSIASYDMQQGDEAIGFALPINDVMIIASQLKTTGVFYPTTLGNNKVLDIQLMTKTKREELSIPLSLRLGVYVESVDSTSVFSSIDADAIILTKLNGIELLDSGHLRSLYFHYPPGYKLNFTYLAMNRDQTSEHTIEVATLLNK